MLRYLLAGEPSVLLRREITIAAAMIAAGTYLLLLAVRAGGWIAAIEDFMAGFVLRSGALLWGWSPPPF